MKTTLLYIFFLFFSFGSFAQQDTTGNDIPTGQDSIHRDSLLLIDSITYTPGNKVMVTKDTLELETGQSSPLSKNIGSPPRSIAGPEDGASPQNLTSSQLDAGRTTGVIDISATGAATYSVPIAVPPGINGAVPQIALVYNSQTGNGIAGYGWNISGMSAITRIPSTRFHDNKVGGVNFDANDRFALDGQRLILKSGTYGGDGAAYQTENYSNIKIISRGVSIYGANYGPMSFEVYYPDGSKAFYGNSIDSRSQLTYALTFTENPLGARVNYYYLNSNNLQFISQISYGGIGSGTPTNQINFVYATSSRKEQSFIGGISFFTDKLLSEINVMGNGSGYRHYFLNHDVLGELNYQRLTSITEESGDGTKSFSPISFGYENPLPNVINTGASNLSLSGVEQRNSKAVTADFTGDGTMDFILYPNAKNKIYCFWDPSLNSPYTQFGAQINTGTFEDIFPVNWLSYNNKFMPGQGFVLVKYVDNSTIKFVTYSAGITAPVYYQYEKQWDNAPGNGYYSNCTNEYVDMGAIPRKFISGDFNGDGLTDIISITKPHQQYYDDIDPNCPGGGGVDPVDQIGDPGDGGLCCITTSYTSSSASVQFINLDRRATSNFVTYSGSLSAPLGTNDQILTADFNGDGKTDVLHITSGKMYVYTLNENNYLQLLWQKDDSRITINLTLPALIGDYNGDGKTDIMFPTSTDYNSNRNKLFALFTSTGKDFVKTESYYPFALFPADWNPSTGRLTTSQLLPTDINGDGKTDMIYYQPTTFNSGTNAYQIFKPYYNVSSTGSAPVFNETPVLEINGDLSHYPIPLFLNNEKDNFNLEFAVISNDKLTNLKFQRDLKKESVVKTVVQDEVIHEISYKSLISDDDYVDLPIYQESYDQTYPYIDIHSAPGLKVVSKLKRTFGTNVINQIFSYEGAVSNAEGLGFLGFKKMTRSNWFRDDDPNRFYNLTLTDPQLRGAVTKTFTTKNPYLNPTVAATAAIEPNIIRTAPATAQEALTASQSITLKPGFAANGANGAFVAKISDPASGINDGATLNDYIARTDYTYDTALSPSKVFINVPTSVMTKDLLNGTNTLGTYAYDSYYNVTTEYSNLSGAGTKTTEITYDNSTGSSYYIGRPLTKKTTATNANDAFSTEEQYTYTGFLPTQIKRKGNGTPFITENLQYDSFGNVTRKGITAGGVERATTTQYDASGRFMTKSTDLEGLETNFTYNPSTGNVLTKTDPYGLSSTLVYDSWGRLIQATDYLGVNTYTNYYKLNAGAIQIFETDDEGHESYTRTDALGNKDLEASKNVMGQWVSKAYRFDSYDRPIKQSEPEIDAEGAYNQWSENTYDGYGRINHTQSYTGLSTNISYDGLSVTVNDGTKSVTTTKNALGNVMSVQDPGGTINYTYYANGNMKSSGFDGSAQTIQQDGWGRKTQLLDPSAGLYTYAYNDFGETVVESTPKGNTTYTYDAIGKLQSKRILGDGTDMSYQYTYDGSTRLLNSLNLANADGNTSSYTYTYDNYKRLQTTVEDNSQARFTKTFSFDGYGRINTETSVALNKGNNRTASKTLLNSYRYGALKSISDNGTGEVIWQVGNVDARGQVTSATMANGHLKQSNTYDQYGFAQELKTERMVNSPAVLMSLGYSFNPQRGILNSRSNSVFAWSETFTHDNQDRLTNFNDNNGNQSQIYDNKGRISSNSFLGNYVYNGASYQQTGLNNVTLDAQRHYQDRVRQDITFNAFKSPVEISETGVEKISFQYNASMGRAHRYYGDESVDKMQRRYRRHYSEDGSMEITEDTQTGTTSFIFYMGGDAYSAPAIWKEVHTPTQTTQAMYYLHRDHLGSIVLITDNQGTAVEKRQFDAWGNIVKLTDGNGNTLADFVIIDRGYTGHEHFLAVGLIDMNARLYDPLLHRFLSPDNYVQDPTNTQNFNRYGYVLNNPLAHIDPSGEFIPLLVFVGAAIIGGGANVWSNWDKIVKNPWSAISYFGSGAVGGAVSVVNPWLGGTITGVANIGVDAAYGNLPKFNSIGDVAKYIGGKALDGLGAAGAGGISKFGYNLASKLGWIQTGAFNGTSFLVGAGTEGVASSVTAPEFILKNTKTTLLEPLLETGANVGKSAATKGGSHLVYEGLDAAGKVKYVGITGRDAAVRFGEHLNSGTARSFLDYRVVEGASGLTKAEAKVWEQTLINELGLQSKGGQLLNKINSVAPKNWWQYGIK